MISERLLAELTYVMTEYEMKMKIGVHISTNCVWIEYYNPVLTQFSTVIMERAKKIMR